MFPAAFGLPSADGKPFQRAATLYSLFDARQGGLDAPDARCLNLIGQPAMIDEGLSWAVRNEGGYELFSSTMHSFDLVQPLLFRDRSSTIILAVPAGASGGVVFKPGLRAEGWEKQELARVLFDRLVIIDQSGGDRAFSAMLSVASSGIVRLCAFGSSAPFDECGPENASREGLPYEYDFTRCAPGCEDSCARGRPKLLACAEPLAPECVGSVERHFLGGRNIGGSCLYEEWDFECAKGCAGGRCDDRSPKLRWSLPLAVNGNAPVPVPLGGGAVATLSGEELVAVSASGRILWREPLASPVVFSLSSDGRGRAFTLDKLGNLRASGASRWEKNLERTNDPGRLTARYGTLAFGAQSLFARWGTRVFAHDPATGDLRWSTDIRSRITGGPVPGPSETVMILVERELVVLDGAGTIRSRVTLPAPPTGAPVVSSKGEVLIATAGGDVLFGPLDALRSIASFPDRVVFDPALAGDGAALLVTAVKSDEPNYTIRKIALPSGVEMWKYSLGWVDEAPLVDARGTAIVVGESLTWLDPRGVRLFSLDLRSNGGRSARALLGDGTLYLLSHARLSALDF